MPNDLTGLEANSIRVHEFKDFYTMLVRKDIDNNTVTKNLSIFAD